MAIKNWVAKEGLYEFNYDGGLHSPVAGEKIYVDTEESTEYATIFAWTLASGTWGVNAAGKMWVYACTAAFITNLENNDVIEDSGGTKICDTTGGATIKEGDWQVPGNWGLGEDPSLPAAADEITFDSRSTISVTDGIAVGETGGIDFNLLHIKKGYSGSIGTANERLHTSAQKIVIEGTGTYYVEVSEDATGKDQAIPLVIISEKAATVYLTSNENTGSWCCKFTEVLVLAGTVYIGDSNIDTAVETLRIAPLENKAGNVTVKIYEDCVLPKDSTKTSIYMDNGVCASDSAINLLELGAGKFTYGTDLGDNPETDLNIEMLRLYGGVLIWQPDDSNDDAYIGKAYLFGGVLNASDSTNADRAKVFGAGAGYDIFVFRGAVLNIANNGGNITIAEDSQLWNFGGEIIMDSGTELGVKYDQP